MNIDGHTNIYGLFGYPIKHTSSPAMHNAGFRKLGIKSVYLPFEVKPCNLGTALGSLAALGIKGVNLTIPHKEAALEFLDGLSPEARLIGAVNTVVIEDGKLTGHNTDALGFIASLEEDLGYSPKGGSVFMLGAGGASKAVAMQLAREGAERIIIADLEEERSRRLSDHIKDNVAGCRTEVFDLQSPYLKKKISEVGLLVNATPIGMKPGDPLPVPEGTLRPDLFVYDLVYNLETTGLVDAAGKKGAKAVTGTGMLLYQGVKAFELWTGQKAPVQVMKEALLKSIK